MLPNRHVGRALAASAIAIVRLVYDLFATPLALALLAFAWAPPARPARLVRRSPASWRFTSSRGLGRRYVRPGALLRDVAAPAAAGRGRRGPDGGSRGLKACADTWPAATAAALVASLVVVSLAGFVPVRLGTVKRIADNVNMPADAIHQARISNAVIFTAGLFTPQECIAPTRHFAYFRPNNDPGLTNDILWVNHLGWEVDHGLMPYFPGRVGYLLQWEGCRAKLTRLLSGPKERM